MGQVGGGRTRAEGVRGGFQAERAANGRYQWQLKAPNGRIVAISSPVFESAAEATEAFDGLRGGAAELTARITHVREGIGWLWMIPGPRGVPEARSSRAYERYATCQNAFRRFIALLERQEPSGPDLPAPIGGAPLPSLPPPPLPLSPLRSAPAGERSREVGRLRPSGDV